MLAARRNELDKYILFFGSLILFTWGLSSQEIIGFDSRFYMFALEMWRYGVSWFPLTYQQPYPDYPSSSTMMIYLFASILGMNKLAAVLPTAILAATTVTLTYLIGSLHNKHWGFCAAMFMLLTSAFVKSARAISLDMYPTVITATCFYLIYSADRENKPQRAWWIYPLLFLGFAFRGPIGLVIPAGVICTYYILNKNFKKLFLHGFFAFLLLCICTALLLALAYHTGGDTFMRDVLRMEILGRMDNHYLPRYFYFTNSFGSYALAYPLAWLVLAGAAFHVYTTRDFSPEMKLLLQLFGWMMVIMMGMSIPDDKKVRYILPILPAVALIAAYPFTAPPTQQFFTLLRTIIRRILLLLPLMVLLLTVAVWLYVNSRSLFSDIGLTSLILILAFMQAANFWLIKNKSIAMREKTLLSVAALCFVFAYIMVIEPMQLYIDRARDFVVSVEAQRLHENARLAFYRESPDGLPIKYLINMVSDDQPVFIHDQSELTDFSDNAYIVTSESYFEDLPKSLTAKFHIIAKGTLGHVNVVVFKRKQE